MSSYYFDATYLGKLFWKEPGSDEVLGFASKADELVCASHGRAEFYSIGFRKRRENLVRQEAIDAVFEQFNADLADGNIRLLSCTEAILDRVEFIFRTAPASVYLRAADAIHLATAAENGFAEVYSNDRHFLAAAPIFGLRGVNLFS